MGVFRRKRGVGGWNVARCREEGKNGGADCPKGDELHRGPPADILAQGDDGAAEAQKSRSKASS